jgi:hypothetical protein
MKKFLKYLFINVMNKYGSFMWFGIHMGVTQVSWHWMLEIGLCLLMNILVIISMYVEWKDSHSK